MPPVSKAQIRKFVSEWFCLRPIPCHFNTMNLSQQQAIDRVFEILSEHFDHVIIAVGTYDEDKQYTTAASFTGGVAAAIGLCKLYEAKWTKEHLWGPDEYEDMDDLN